MEKIKNVHILAAKTRSTLKICPEQPFWGLPQCRTGSRCENALVFNFFHDRFGLDGRNSRGSNFVLDCVLEYLILKFRSSTLCHTVSRGYVPVWSAARLSKKAGLCTILPTIPQIC